MMKVYTKKFVLIKIILSLFLTNIIASCQLLPEDFQVKTYRVPVQQGNVIEQNNVDKLRINMTKEQVEFLLGKPILNNIFNKNRWDYAYYKKMEPDETKLSLISLFFKDDKLTSIKRIAKNKDGLFQVNTNKEPEFSENHDKKITNNELFETIKLEGSINENIIIENFNNDAKEKNNVDKNNEENKNIINSKKTENLGNTENEDKLFEKNKDSQQIENIVHK